MIDGVAFEPTYVLVDGVIHDVWRVATRKHLCNTQCGIDAWLDLEKPTRTMGTLCEGPATCIDCIALREVL